MPPLKVVLDTNVVFEGLTKQGSSAALLVEIALAGLLQIFITDALAYEYVDVLSRKLTDARWQSVEIILTALLDQCEFVQIHYSWRPSTPDPGDDHVIDCAMNAGAILVSSNLRDFRLAQKHLGLRVMPPSELLALLTR